MNIILTTIKNGPLKLSYDFWAKIFGQSFRSHLVKLPYFEYFFLTKEMRKTGACLPCWVISTSSNKFVRQTYFSPMYCRDENSYMQEAVMMIWASNIVQAQLAFHDPVVFQIVCLYCLSMIAEFHVQYLSPELKKKNPHGKVPASQLLRTVLKRQEQRQLYFISSLSSIHKYW